MQSFQTQFRDRVEAFLRQSNMTPTAFGVAVLNDPRFVFQLREGRDLRGSTMQKVLDFIDKHQGEAA